ncbi:hypothetical protein GQ55_9G474400 [Panicum hallii var. hallii]|uniref:Uncharacterized protein n=1 Tax=Panicum hallii var. hallii TaxID=1504633 RepID=A0A2T7CCL6_9POAL|nr:hypothetical protein GQ55_9G474400 [Panicum hallii var. hallii]
MPELDDVHRLLPREILVDIGIVDPAEQQLLDVVEDLQARLAVVLGGNNPNIASAARPQANAARGLGGTDIVLSSRGNNVRRAVPAPPLNSPARPVPGWHAMAGVKNDMVFAPAMPLGARAQLTTVRRRAGTGVFLPRTEGGSACRTARATAPRPPGNSQGSGFFYSGGQQQAATVVVRTQQQMQPVAGQVMEQKYLGAHARPVFSRATTGVSLLRHESYSNHGSFQALHACTP